MVTRVVLRLLRRLKGEDAVKEAVDEILPQLKTLSAKLELIGTVGHVEGLGHKLVTPDQAAEFEKSLAAEIHDADDSALSSEWDLLRLLIAPARWFADTGPRKIDVSASARLHVAVIRSAISEMRSQSMGSRHLHITKTLSWDTLVLIYGTEDNIRLVLEKIQDDASKETADVRDLVEKYLSGWRPDRHDFDDEE